MARCSKVCWVELGGCGRKQVFYSPEFQSKYIKEDKPFKCKICGKRFSYKDLGLKRGQGSSHYKPVYSSKVDELCKILRENNRAKHL